MAEEAVQVITYDVGTTGMKTCLFEIGKEIKLLDSEMAEYGLYILEGGGAEQDPEEWWQAMCESTRRLLEKTGTDPRSIAGISFCSQLQGLVLVDEEGRPVRRMMSYMDQRARQVMHEHMSHGLQFSGVNVFKLLKSIRETGAVSASAKDPVWKYKWVEKHEPENFRRTHKWLDVKEFLILRSTGEFIRTEDSAFASLLYNIREGQKGWSRAVCDMIGVNMDHLPPIIKSVDKAGEITTSAAPELGLPVGTPVFGGGGDSSLIGVGAGAVEPGDTHIYTGTSGWVSTVVENPVLDPVAMIAAIVGAQPGKFNYFAEMETAGKCLEWVKDNLALDEIGIYMQKTLVNESRESLYASLYDFIMEMVDSVPVGAGGVIFTPWLHGNRCPFEDSYARGMFFNISLETGKLEMMRAVLEGVCFHLRWMLEAHEKKVKASEVLRFVGGGALSDVTSQVLADITGRSVETVDNSQNVGAVGAAIVVGVGLGILDSFETAKEFVSVKKKFSPDPQHKETYDRNYRVFKNLYPNNQKNFKQLNE